MLIGLMTYRLLVRLVETKVENGRMWCLICFSKKKIWNMDLRVFFYVILH